MADSSTTAALNRLNRLEQDFLTQASDQPRVGYLCLRVPVELLEALGMIPIRLISEIPSAQEPINLIRTDACSFCRSILPSLCTPRYTGLSAVIAGACCDQMRRLMDTLSVSLDLPVILYSAPRTYGLNKNYFFNEMNQAFGRLGLTLGYKFNRKILATQVKKREHLRQKILIMRDEGRLPSSLLHRLAESPLPSDMLLGFLDELPPSVLSPDRIRLLLMGSIPSGKELAVIEEFSGEVVADATCLGDRAFYTSRSEAADPLENLYNRVVEGNLCPHRRPNTPLTAYVRELIVRRAVEGVVYRSVKYCHPFGLSALRFKEELGLPFLQLDDDLTLTALGSFRTRIGAFVEMLTMKRRRRL